MPLLTEPDRELRGEDIGAAPGSHFPACDGSARQRRRVGAGNRWLTTEQQRHAGASGACAWYSERALRGA